MRLSVAILAGGLATRLRPFTESIPKVLLQVAGEPFAIHQIKLLKRQGLLRVVFCVGHLGDQVQSALGDGSRWGIELDYVSDGATLLGTGGALQKALPILGESFFVLYGDSYLECDFQAVENVFRVSNKQGLMTVFRNQGRWDRSNVVFSDGSIQRYNKRHPSPDMEYIDYGLGVLRADAFMGFPKDCNLDLATVYQKLIERNELAGFEVMERFYEIGSLAGLEETRKHLENVLRT